MKNRKVCEEKGLYIRCYKYGGGLWVDSRRILEGEGGKGGRRRYAKMVGGALVYL